MKTDPLKGHGKFLPGVWVGFKHINYCNKCHMSESHIREFWKKCLSPKKKPKTDKQRINFLAGCINGISIGQFVFKGKAIDFWCGGSRDKRSLRLAIDKAIDQKNANGPRKKK